MSLKVKVVAFVRSEDLDPGYLQEKHWHGHIVYRSRLTLIINVLKVVPRRSRFHTYSSMLQLLNKHILI